MGSANHHIAILCSRLDLPGGIERAVVNTANLFFAKGHTITLVILDDTDNSFYPIHAGVQVLQQPLSFGITQEGNVITRKIKLLGDVLKLRRLLKQLQADLIIASEYPLAAAAILAGGKKQSKVVSWEHHHYYELQRNSFWNNVFRLTYPRLDAIVCLNKDEQQLFATINHNPVVVPNFIEAGSSADTNNKMILTIARLTAVKGIEHLLKVAKAVLTAHPDWKWKLIGDGEMKEEVLAYMEKEKLAGKLILQPPVDHNVLPEYQQAAMYVMTSLNECFPMTLLEAQATGLPCIAFDCDSGPRHIITKENGILVKKEDTTSLAEAISTVINNESLRNSMREKALEHVNHFSPDTVYALWQQQVFTLL